MPMQRVLIIACLLLLAACWAAWSLHAASARCVLGHLPRTAIGTTIAAVRRNPELLAGKTVCLTGRMTERCPTAGCWFYLNDGTGDLRADARGGGFSVLGVRIGAQLTVFGTVDREPGEDLQLQALGARS